MKLDCGVVLYVLNPLLSKTTKHFKSKYQKQKEKFSAVVEEYESITPDINETDSIFDNCARDCYKKYYHTFETRCIDDFEMTNDDFISGKISDKKLFIARQKLFIFNQVNKLPIKIFSSLSNIFVCYYLKFRKSNMHGQFLKTIFEKPEF